jgi:phage regulator Rha-like protein
MSEKAVIPIERIAEKIYLIRDEKVMLDADLAALYGVETRVLVQAVKRNIERFPPHFMFQLSEEEFEYWRSQIVMSNPSAKMGLRRPPYAFTEQGVAMLSAVLRSKQAVQISIAIMDAFVRLREMLATHKDIARKVAEHDRHIANLYAHVEKLLSLPEPKKNPIGYIWPKDDEDEAD